MINTLFENPFIFLANIIALFVAITIHEFSHALAADRLGDPTPQLQGRLTLDPRKHIDPFGLLFILIAGFGWGRPVEFDPYNLKDPRKDAAIISIAGPISNFLVALLCSILLRMLLFFPNFQLIIIGQFILIPLITLNIILGVFNLVPIHPLDGFKIVGGLLPRDKADEWNGLARYGMIFLLLLIIPFGDRSMLDTFLRPIMSFVFPIFIPGY